MNRPHKPVPAWAWLGYALSTAGWLLLLVLPGHKYAWMAAVDPATDPALLLDASGNRVVLATVVMVLAVGLQLIWLLRLLWLLWLLWLPTSGKAGPTHGKHHALLAGLLIMALLALWALKF